MKFRHEFMTQTQLGEVFGVTSHQVGRWLTEIDLRYDSGRGMKPSSKAFDGGFVKHVGNGPGRYIWVWHSERTVEALAQAGHVVVLHPAHELVAPCKLNGPFELRPHPRFGYEVVNGDGSVAINVAGKENVRLLIRLLNAADKHGVFTKNN